MSKSLGNVLQLHQLLEQHPPEVLRYLLLRAHYRQPLEWSDDTLKQAKATLDGWYGVLRDLSDVSVTIGDADVPAAIENALCDDLNTPQAFAELAKLADDARGASSAEEKRRAKAALLAAGGLLGLLQQDPEVWFKGAIKMASGFGTGDSVTATLVTFAQQVEDLIKQRDAARAARDFSRADAIRDQLSTMGVAIEDGPQGTRWKRIAV
jgi:cysteinyl-tRNA synthetase